MINTGFCGSFYRLIAPLMWALVATPMAMAQDEAASPMPAGLPAEYHQCHEVLWSAPMTTLSEFVDDGLGARIRTGFLGDNLSGVRCTDDQLVDYTEHHGLRYLSTENRPKVEKTFRGDFDRRIYFCIKPHTLLDRLFFGRCVGGAEYMMLGDEIAFITAGGSK